MGVSGRLKKQRVDEAEDGGVNADSAGQGEDGNDAEPGRFEQKAKGEAKILDHISYSVRSAWIGSTSVARRAGIKQARRAANAKTVAVAPSNSGLCGEI